jgi:hypothetical protein
MDVCLQERSLFLAKREDFLVAFAARYDGQPWLRHVDILTFAATSARQTYPPSPPGSGGAAAARRGGKEG